MTRPQIILIAASLVFLAILFFGFDTVPKEQAQVEKSRALNVETAELQTLVDEARASIPPDEKSFFNTYENIARSAQTDSARIEALENLSAGWYQRGEFAVAGYYAEQIANIEPTALNWEAAGMTFWSCINSDLDTELRTMCLSHAETSFQNAISLDPENVNYRLNLAVCYATLPPQDNPMKGVMSLLALNSEYPENTSVLYWLARFGLQTGQTEKAIGRLQTALELEPGEKRFICLLADAYQQAGNQAAAEEYAAKCQED